MLKKFVIVLLLTTSSFAQAALKIQHWVLDNGARVYFVENRTIPMLDVNLDFDAGSRRDPANKAGLASLTNGMFARGIAKATLPDGGVEPAMSEADISDAIADTAAQRGGGVSADRGSVSIRTLSSLAEREQSIKLLARLLAQPSFPQDLFERDKARTIASIREGLTRPDAIASKAFWRLNYGMHPYGAEATVESVQATTREDLVRFHREHYVANRAVVAMIGDITRAEADAIAKELTRRLPQGAALPELPKVAVPAGAEQRIAHPASQAHILFGLPTLARSDPDFFALTVGNYVLGGGGFVSRLTREVREKRGLAYSAYSYFNPMAQPGPYMAGLQTRKDQADDALKVMRETIDSYVRNGPTEEELRAAKDNLIGGFALRIDNNRKILDHIANIGFYEMPLDYLDTWTQQVAKLSAADIRAAFQRKLMMDRMITVVVGAEGAKP
jgi:zinc protease